MGGWGVTKSDMKAEQEIEGEPEEINYLGPGGLLVSCSSRTHVSLATEELRASEAAFTGRHVDQTPARVAFSPRIDHAKGHRGQI